MRADIIEHAMARSPEEACGFVVARPGEDPSIICCMNIHPTPVTRFKIDDAEIHRALVQFGEENLLAIYHSHPATQPHPSGIDRSGAHYPDAIYLIASLQQATPDIRGFQIKKDWISEVELV